MAAASQQGAAGAAWQAWGLHLLVLGVLLVLGATLSGYHATNLARILVLATFAIGYNLAFGYLGLLSLGHALFFAAGMYGFGLPVHLLEWSAWPAVAVGVAAGGAAAFLTGLLALRTAGVSFMIVTLMFAQAFHLTILYFNRVTEGDQGFAVEAFGRRVADVELFGYDPRFAVAWGLFAVALVLCLWLVRSRFGRVLAGLRDNEDRARMLGFNPYRIKLAVLTLSGVYAGAAGAAYGLLFDYVGATFATIQYSILPMLYVLLGGAGTVLGPLLGAVLMFYLIDYASELTPAYNFVVGAVLVILVLFAPKGLLGTVRERVWRGLP